MDVIRIATESPKAEQWSQLSQYAYTRNIKRYLMDRGFTNVEHDILNYIAGCIRQGHAYFIASETTPLDIAPLLLYYGSTHLLAGAAALLTGGIASIKDHGMKFKIPGTAMNIGDGVITPSNPETGGLQTYCNVFSNGCNLTNGGQWTVEDILSSIPDLKAEFEHCYTNGTPRVIPVEIEHKRKLSLERIAQKEIARYKRPYDAFEIVVDFYKAYLRPMYHTGADYINLHYRVGGITIGTYNTFGQKFLQVGHKKNGLLVSPEQVILMHMGLFALGYLSRYLPETWHPFVHGDTTGERLVIEKFLSICQRFLPNLILNALRGARVVLVYETERILDRTTATTQADVEEIVKEMRRRGDI